ncbi:thiamine-phosphate kinase [Selenomonadales bacterium OttesenSCG-928-I06]|nr:thiamine-phosphate kinase [Selenomonadales bacterium OttesenSCG-928-I06]
MRDLTLKQIGEFSLIDLIKEDTVHNKDTVIEGIGDDAAVVSTTEGYLQLLTTDMLVENIHFNLNFTDFYKLGNKAIAVNLSDIAAMGGVPRQALISMALPKDTEIKNILELYKGMKDICKKFSVNIVGGDTVSTFGPIVINVALVGEVKKENLVKRSGAQVGDLLLVSGALGSSAAGLEILQNDLKDKFDFAKELIKKHLVPNPRVELGQLLGKNKATSIDDISDGLASECNEIASASQVGIRIYKEKIPVSKEVHAVAEYLNKSYVDYALYGGEDFELLFTMNPRDLENFSKKNIADIFVIGEIVNVKEGVTIVDFDGQSTILEAKGYNHFR